MAGNFKSLRESMPPEAQAEAHRRAGGMLEKMALHELRRERKKTQSAVAERMQVTQGEVSKIEQRADMRLGTLRDYVDALGGTLGLRAVFPDRSVELVVSGER